MKPNEECVRRPGARQVLLGAAPPLAPATEQAPAAPKLPQVRGSDEEAEGLPPPEASRLLKRLALQAREAMKAPCNTALQ